MLTYLSVIMNLPMDLPHRQRGLTTVEYAIAGALIVVAIIVVIGLVGTKASNTFNKLQGNMG